MKGFTKGKGKGRKFIPTNNDKGSMRAVSKEDIHKRAGDIPSSIGNQDLIRKKSSLDTSGIDDFMIEQEAKREAKAKVPLPERDTPEWNKIEKDVKERIDHDFNEVRLENLSKVNENWVEDVVTVEPSMEDVKDYFGDSKMSDEEFEEAHGESEIDDAKIELQDGQREIMWGTVFESRDSRMTDLIMEHKEAIINDVGFNIIDMRHSDEDGAYSEGVFLGVNGAGYDFYDAHWMPLYRLFGWV